MKRMNSPSKNGNRLFWLSLSLSCVSLGLSHFAKVRETWAREQRQVELDAASRDCEQLRRETDAHYAKAKAMMAQKSLSKADLEWARNFSARCDKLDARRTALQRRLDEICRPENQQ